MSGLLECLGFITLLIFNGINEFKEEASSSKLALLVPANEELARTALQDAINERATTVERWNIMLEIGLEVDSQ